MRHSNYSINKRLDGKVQLKNVEVFKLKGKIARAYCALTSYEYKRSQ